MHIPNPSFPIFFIALLGHHVFPHLLLLLLLFVVLRTARRRRTRGSAEQVVAGVAVRLGIAVVLVGASRGERFEGILL